MGKFDAKKDQKCEFWLHIISVKIKMFKRLFKHCYFSVGILTLVKSSAKWKHLEQKGISISMISRIYVISILEKIEIDL